MPASGVSAVVLNVTAIGHGTGYLTAFPAGVTTPTASNLNFSAGQNVPNRVIVPVGTDGQVSFTTNTSVDVVVDVNGWFTDGSSPAQTGALFVATTPTRICDTRTERQHHPVRRPHRRPAGHLATWRWPARARCPPPAWSPWWPTSPRPTPPPRATSRRGPPGPPSPTASDLNWVAGLTVPNMAVVGLGTGGDISVYVNSGSADVIVDVTGWYVNES